MTNKMSFKKEGDAAHLTITGAINEGSVFPEIRDCQKLVIEFENLMIFNSCGIRLWLTWSAGLKKVKKISLENCPVQFIQQANFVSEIIPSNAVITSFFVPFFDEETNESREVKMVRGSDFDENGFTLPKVVNSKGTPLKLDVDKTYFSLFFKHR